MDGVCLMMYHLLMCIKQISRHCNVAIVAKVTPDSQWGAHSLIYPFLLSVNITRAQFHDGLSIPLMKDTETAGNKDEAKESDGNVFTGEKKKKGGKRITQ